MAVDIILNQRQRNSEVDAKSKLYCVYVCVGKSKAEREKVVARLQEGGAMDYTTVVCADETASYGMQYLAPFAGSTAANYYRDNGMDVLIVYDDLGAHGQAYVNMSRRFEPPIHAITYVHGRLLERSAKLNAANGGGSSTAICLVETDKSERPRVLVETLMGYCDHFTVLDPQLSVSNVWPPINCSSVIGKPPPRFQPRITRPLFAQLSQMLVESESLAHRLSLAAEFGLEMEEEDRPMYEFAQKLQVLLSQGDGLPLHKQMVVMFAALHNWLAQIPTDKLDMYEAALLEFMSTELYQPLMTQLAALDINQDMPAEVHASLEKAVWQFHTQFCEAIGVPLPPAPASLLAEEE